MGELQESFNDSYGSYLSLLFDIGLSSIMNLSSKICYWLIH